MNKKLAVIAIAVKDRSYTDQLNKILNRCGEYVIGRIGLPYQNKKVHIINITLDAPEDVVEMVLNEIKQIECMSAKALYLEG